MIFNKQKTFINQVKALNKGQQADSQLIWKSLEGLNADQNVSYFCLQLFEQVLHSDKKSYLLHNQERMYATLLFMELTKNKKLKNPKILQQCSKFLQKMEPSHGKTFLQFLFGEDREEKYFAFFINQMFKAPSFIDWSRNLVYSFQCQLEQTNEYLKTRRGRKSITLHHQSFKYQSYKKIILLQSKIMTFGYFCFVDQIIKNKNTIELKQYEHLCEVLKYLMNVTDGNVAAEELFPIATHFVVKLVQFYGVPVAIITKFMLWAEQLRKFPGKIGKMGDWVFQKLSKELMLPGSLFRAKLIQNFPSLGVKQNNFINKAIYMVTDCQNIFSRGQDISLITLRKLIITHALKNSQLPQQQTNHYISFIKQLSQAKTFLLYQKLLKILNLVQQLNKKAQIDSILCDNLSKLFKQMIKKSQSSEENKLNIDIDQYQNFMKKSSKNGYFSYPNFEIISIPIADFLSKDSQKSFTTIIQKHTSNLILKKQKISFLLMGNGATFFKFLQAFSQYYTEVSLEDRCGFKIYYVPKNDNNICRTGVGKYLANIDAWYRKFVFNMHFKKILYPYLQVNNGNKDLLPFTLMSRSVQYFIKEAQFSTQIRVYRCYLTIDDHEKQQILYMASYFAVGLFCEAIIIKIQKQTQKYKEDKEYNKETIEIVYQKLKKSHPLRLSLETQVFDSLSGKTKIKKEADIKIQDLQVCNLPCEYFVGKSPKPGSPFLQMSFLTQNNGKIFKKQIGKQQHFKQNIDFQSVMEAFKDLYVISTVKSLTIENLDKQSTLRIMIDGSIADQVQKIRIQPATSKSGLPIALQMQCFLPS